MKQNQGKEKLDKNSYNVTSEYNTLQKNLINDWKVER